MVVVERTEAGLVISAEQKVSPWARPFYTARRIGLHFGELWYYRDLLRNLVVRDLKVRYRNSVLGVLWSLGNPILMMLVFTFVFTVMTGFARSENFPVFVLCAILPWNFFS